MVIIVQNCSFQIKSVWETQRNIESCQWHIEHKIIISKADFADVYAADQMPPWLIQQSTVRVPFRPCRRDNGVVGCWINLKRARLSGSSSSRAATRNNIISSSAGPHNTKLGFALCVCVSVSPAEAEGVRINNSHLQQGVRVRAKAKRSLVVYRASSSSFATPRRRAERDPSRRRNLYIMARHYTACSGHYQISH